MKNIHYVSVKKFRCCNKNIFFTAAKYLQSVTVLLLVFTILVLMLFRLYSFKLYDTLIQKLRFYSFHTCIRICTVHKNRSSINNKRKLNNIRLPETILAFVASFNQSIFFYHKSSTSRHIIIELNIFLKLSKMMITTLDVFCLVHSFTKFQITAIKLYDTVI